MSCFGSLEQHWMQWELVRDNFFIVLFSRYLRWHPPQPPLIMNSALLTTLTMSSARHTATYGQFHALEVLVPLKKNASMEAFGTLSASDIFKQSLVPYIPKTLLHLFTKNTPNRRIEQ